MNQLYAYIYPHIPSLLSLPLTVPLPPLYVVTKHRADLPGLCSSFPLAIHFTFGSVYMSMLLSHVDPDSPLHLCPQVLSLVGLCLYSHLATRFFMTFFFFLRFHIYVLAYSTLASSQSPARGAFAPHFLKNLSPPSPYQSLLLLRKLSAGASV